MGITDEKDLSLIAIIMGVFILTTLSQTIGVIYLGMSVAYAIAVNQGRSRVYEFVRGRHNLQMALLLGVVLVGGFLIIGGISLGAITLEAAAPIQILQSSFVDQFTIDNYIIKFVVFGMFIPVVETLFFYGVIFKFIMLKAGATGQLTQFQTILSITMIGAIATSFHFIVRLFNDQALLMDFIFFTLSAVIVLRQKELSGAATGHAITNSWVILRILGVLS